MTTERLSSSAGQPRSLRGCCWAKEEEAIAWIHDVQGRQKRRKYFPAKGTYSQGLRGSMKSELTYWIRVKSEWNQSEIRLNQWSQSLGRNKHSPHRGVGESEKGVLQIQQFMVWMCTLTVNTSQWHLTARNLPCLICTSSILLERHHWLHSLNVTPPHLLSHTDWLRGAVSGKSQEAARLPRSRDAVQDGGWLRGGRLGRWEPTVVPVC